MNDDYLDSDMENIVTETLRGMVEERDSQIENLHYHLFSILSLTRDSLQHHSKYSDSGILKDALIDIKHRVLTALDINEDV